MVRLIRSLLAMLVAVSLAGAPAIQAAIAMPCDAMIMSAADHQLSDGNTPASMPCKEKMPGCANMVGCGVSASSSVRTSMVINQPFWTAATYWPVADLLEGLSIQPDLGPPIAI